MLPSGNYLRVCTKAAFAACGLAGVLVLAACGSNSSSTPGASVTTVASKPTASPAPTAGALPSWATALGSSVTVVAPHSASPGHSSPGAAIAGTVAAFDAKDYAKSCLYAEPTLQAECKSQASQVPASQIPTVKNFAVGYTVIDGDRAAVGTTGTFCSPGHSPECATNNAPAAVFSTTSSFSALWSNAIKNTSGYSLTPCIKIGDKWYIYSASLCVPFGRPHSSLWPSLGALARHPRLQRPRLPRSRSVRRRHLRPSHWTAPG